MVTLGPVFRCRQVVAIKKCKRIFEDLVDCKRILREVHWKFLVHWLAANSIGFHLNKDIVYIMLNICLQYAFFSEKHLGPTLNFSKAPAIQKSSAERVIGARIQHLCASAPWTGQHFIQVEPRVSWKYLEIFIIHFNPLTANDFHPS